MSCDSGGRCRSAAGRAEADRDSGDRTQAAPSLNHPNHRSIISRHPTLLFCNIRRRAGGLGTRRLQCPFATGGVMTPAP